MPLLLGEEGDEAAAIWWGTRDAAVWPASARKTCKICGHLANFEDVSDVGGFDARKFFHDLVSNKIKAHLYADAVSRDYLDLFRSEDVFPVSLKVKALPRCEVASRKSHPKSL